MVQGSRDKILQEARDLFYQRGFLATSVDDILEHAKVSKSNFYYHFKTKEDLGIAVLLMRCEEFQTALSESLCNESLSPRNRLQRLFALIAESSETQASGGCPFGNLVVEMSEHSERFRVHLSEMFAGLANLIAEVVAEGQRSAEIRSDISPRDTAALIVQSIQGGQLLLKCHRSPECYARSMDLLLRLIEPTGPH